MEEEREEKREEKKRNFLVLSLIHTCPRIGEEERFASPCSGTNFHHEKEREDGIFFYHH